MTWLQGRAVRFRLSSEGKEALAGIFEKDSVEALVEIVDDLGAWLMIGKGNRVGSKILVLLKWDYFATATVEILPSAEVAKASVGFGIVK